MNWINVNERLPENGQRVLVTHRNPNSEVVAIFIELDNGKYDFQNSWDFTLLNCAAITHWAALPEQRHNIN